MVSVLVLIAAPGAHAIDDTLIAQLRGLTGSAPTWLAKNEAVEFSTSAQIGGVQEVIGKRLIDFAILPAGNRKKRLLLADMDSTIIGQECIDELGTLAGVGSRISAITRRAMAGELDFEGALRERVSLLKGQVEGGIAHLLRDTITIEPGAATLVATMKAHGAHTALVSGGFVQFTGDVAERVGFDEHQANELMIEDGRLTGKVREPILGRDAKLNALHTISRRLGISLGDAIAVGDGANDIPMLKAAGIGVALHAKPKVRAEAPVKIDHGDLTALLYLQGYGRDEFVLT